MFDSSGGFRFPDGSVLSPDASVVRQDRWLALMPEQRRSFTPQGPDLVFERVSFSDEGPRGEAALRRKLATNLANGTQLGWELVPERRAVQIWRAPSATGALTSSPHASPAPEAPARAGQLEHLEPAERLDGGDLFPGLRLELAEI